MSDYLHQINEAHKARKKRMGGVAPPPPPPPEPSNAPTWKRCIALVTTTYERRIGKRDKFVPITPDEIRSGNRIPSIVRARQLAIYLTRRSSRLSLPQIGRHFNRHHATVIHSIAKVEEIMDKSPGAKEEIERLLALVKPPEPQGCPSPPPSSSPCQP